MKVADRDQTRDIMFGKQLSLRCAQTFKPLCKFESARGPWSGVFPGEKRVVLIEPIRQQSALLAKQANGCRKIYKTYNFCL